ncbi:MAG: hypothetical protein Q8Q23_01900 [bacterium]|nr:hypothetical protein [bacterium]
MNTKVLYVLAAGTGVVLTTALVAGVSMASSGSFRQGFSSANHQAVMAAIENGDFAAWQEAVGDGPKADLITEENFSKLSELHSLVRDGKLEEAKALQAELGLPAMGHFGMMGRMGKFEFGNHAAVQEAINNNDYNAWKEAMGDHPNTEIITEENFGKLAEMHNLIKEGKFDEAEAIRAELGLPTGQAGLPEMKKFMHKRGPLHDANGDGVCDWTEQQAESGSNES